MSSKEHAHNQDRSPARKSTMPQGAAPAPGEMPLIALPDLVQRAKLAPQSLSPADLKQLQRTAGNRAVDQLLARPGPTPAARSLSRVTPGVVQRLATPTERRTFAASYSGLLASLKKGKTDNWPQVHPLLAQAQTLQLDIDMPDMFQQLQALDMIVSGPGDAKARKLAIKQRLASMDPRSRTGPEAYTGISAAMFAPEMNAGAFQGPGMKALELAETGRLGPGASDVDVKINLVLDKLQQAYAMHRVQPPLAAAMGGAPPKVLSIFAGPEWYFREPAGPYTRNAENQIIQTFLEVSALYPDMLIMPGSIVSGDFKKGAWTNVTNSAPVFWNGNHLTTVHKSEACGDITPFKGVKEMKEPSLFNIGDLRGAMEICADHAKRRAAREVERKQKPAGPNLAPSFEIVAGAGQTATAQKSAVRHQGFVMSADSTGQGAQLIQVNVAGATRTDPGFEAGQVLAPDVSGQTTTHTWQVGEDRAVFRANRIRFGNVILADTATEITYAKNTAALTYYGSRLVP